MTTQDYCHCVNDPKEFGHEAQCLGNGEVNASRSTAQPGPSTTTRASSPIDLSLHEMRLLDYALQFYYLRADKGALEGIRTDIVLLHEKFSGVYIPERERLDRLARAHSAVRGAGELKPAKIFHCATEHCHLPVNAPGEHCPDCSGGA